MLGFMNLRKIGQGWQFENEETLEDFAWANLRQLLGLTPLKRQYGVKGQICDILAVDDNKRLVVLELKNSEDRYIVQQLTRYYDALLEEKPFKEVVDYTKPIYLIGITPRIHRDNLIDRKYHHLSLQFLQFEIVITGEKLYLQLKDIDTGKLFPIEIPSQERASTESLPIPPKLLQKLLSSCSPEQLKVIMEIRNQILSFDKRMEEISIAGSLKYGNGKSKNSKYCAEFCSDSKGNFLIFLWIPLRGLTSEKIGRARIWTDWNDKALVEGYVSRGIGAEITLYKKVILNRDKKLKKNSSGKLTYGTAMNNIRQYCKDINRIRRRMRESQPVTHEELKYIEAYIEEHDNVPYKSLKSLVDLSLKKWLERL
ncbi:MAG TPA: endonuclease NucS domain-containing protein [Candidatus Sericytochromatia bacterium]